MNVVTAPEPLPQTWRRSVFLAGGITGCPDWQGEVIEALRRKHPGERGRHDPVPALTVFNPRRANFPIDDPYAAQEQIVWERTALDAADQVVFWFPAESVCPIALYELGAESYSMTVKTLTVGTHPDYPRKADVVIQTSLVRPDVEVVHSLERLIERIAW